MNARWDDEYRRPFSVEVVGAGLRTAEAGEKRRSRAGDRADVGQVLVLVFGLLL